MEGPRTQATGGRSASHRVGGGSTLLRNTMAPFLLGKEGDGAIVVSFRPEREHPPITNALVTGLFHIDFFRGK